MKKLFFIAAAALILTLMASRESFAAYVPFSEFKIVGQSGDTTWTGLTNGENLPVFTLNQTPYLYIKLPTNFIYAEIDTTWTSPNNTAIPDNDHYQAFWNGRDLWLSLANWNSVKTTGTWKVDGSYLTCLCKNGKGSASFVVTPEPMSLVLYGIGGMPLMAHFIRRRKTLTV